MKLSIPHFEGKTLVLASKSPRRQELVRSLGLPVEVRIREIDEVYPDNLPARDVAAYLAKRKAAPLIGTLGENEVLLTGDTTVVLQDTVLNKPADRRHAEAMLRSLSGCTHEVITGVCMVYGSHHQVFSDSAEVTFGELDDLLIQAYLDTGSPFDKAGAYGIQDDFGKIAVERINGSFFTVMGFPVHLIYRTLKKFADMV